MTTTILTATHQGFHWPRQQPLYARTLHQIDFNVPRRHNIPRTIHDRKQINWTKPEQERYQTAKQFSNWFRDITTCFLDELDRLVIITLNGLETPNAPILLAHPIERNNGHNITTITMEDGEYELITDFGAQDLTQHYKNQHPTAQYWFALRNKNRPRTQEQ